MITMMEKTNEVFVLERTIVTEHGDGSSLIGCFYCLENAESEMLRRSKVETDSTFEVIRFIRP